MALTNRQIRRKQWLESMLNAIEARLAGDIADGGSSMSINGRSLQRYSLDELNTLHRVYSNELTGLEQKEAGRSKYSTVRVRF